MGVFQVNIKSEFEEPERKKRHYDDDDGDLVTAEILFKKFSSDVAADAADHDEVPSEKGDATGQGQINV